MTLTNVNRVKIENPVHPLTKACQEHTWHERYPATAENDCTKQVNLAHAAGVLHTEVCSSLAPSVRLNMAGSAS